MEKFAFEKEKYSNFKLSEKRGTYKTKLGLLNLAEHLGNV